MSTPQTCLALLQEMVAIDSVNATISHRPHPEAALSDYLASRATEWGLSATRMPVGEEGAYNLLVRHEASPGAPWILFESHLDTVGLEGMTVPPLEAHVSRGRVYGRGACDTKSSGAAMLWALAAYVRSGAQPNNVAVLFSVDEEALKTGINAWVASLADIGPRPAGAIVGEPTGMRPVVAHCGVVRWAIRTHGLAAHSSDPTRGRSAIRAMLRVIDALEERYIAHLSASHPLTGPARCSVTMIHGGTAVNVVPDLCEIWVDRRVVPGEDPETVLPEVRGILDTLREEVGDLSYSLGEPFIDRPLSPVGSEALAAWVGGVLSAMGLPGEPQGVGYGSDGSTLSAAGIPVVLLGPGDVAQAHSEAEYLEIEQLDRAASVYQRLMRTPLGGGA
jgi:acetylornithine deacetylase